MTSHALGLVLGVSAAAGLNLYATVAALGLLQRLGVATLPPSLHVLSHPAVLAIAIALYAVEFVADKIPAVDHVWDAIHTFIRPPAAAVLAFAAVANVPEPWRVAAALLAGVVALTSHGGKATSRIAVNASPEPFSNWVVSLGEDGLAVTLAWLAATHPIVALALGTAVTIAAVVAIVVTVRLIRGAARLAFGRSRRPAG
ncbi:MAG TPA: DUF4126 domain-containing protein [Candidatus Eisenbacteria bacterium]